MATESAAATASLDPLPSGLIRLRDGRIAPRRQGWVAPGENIRCPFNHHVNPAEDLHEGAITTECKNRSGDGSGPRQAPCGAKFFVSTGTMGFFWADMTDEEDKEIKRLGIKPVNVARYLGIHFPK